MALLKKRPLTSGELIRVSGKSAPAVYSILTALRKSGAIETRTDESDGHRKNFLVG